MCIAFLNYIGRVYIDRIKPQYILPIPPGGLQVQREGFTDGSNTSDGNVFLNNDQLYDSFYASIYDQLTQGAGRAQSKVSYLISLWKKNGTTVDQMDILDAGCGTGVSTATFAKAGVHSVLGLDKSTAMIERAKNHTLRNMELTPEQEKTITFRQGDLMNPSAIDGGSISHAACLYFTIYYMPDIETFFRNMFSWIKPGGMLAVEVVNKYKFDPMLDSAAPWISFSLQKYTKERITESKVTFDKFEYTGKFDLEDPGAEFRETFRFKDGNVRRQKHRLTMPSIEEIVRSAQAVGWVYTKYFDLTMLGFEYAYLLNFRRKD